MIHVISTSCYLRHFQCGLHNTSKAPSDRYGTTFAGFAKTFCPSLVILSEKAGVLRQTFWVFVSHFTLKMVGKYDYFAGHIV